MATDGRSSGPPRLLCIDKPEGPTSFDMVARVRRITGYRRVGHGGTLDPFATGVLVIGLGPATRLMRFAASGDKVYEATVQFGAETDSEDRTGEVVREVALQPSEDAIREALPAFVGRIEQVPPRLSAVHVGGERSYRRARRGEEIDPAPREVEVHSLELVRCSGSRVVLRVECGGGTYVRSLARDLGRALEGAAHLHALRRTRVGPFGLDDAIGPGPLQDRWAEGDRGLDPSFLVRNWPSIELTDDLVARVRQGAQPDPEWWSGRSWTSAPERVALHDGRGQLVAVATPDSAGALRLALVLPESG